MRQFLVFLLTLILLFLFSCSKNPGIDVSSSEKFHSSVEEVIQSNSDQLNSYDLRMIFSFALGAADFRELDAQSIKEFKGMNKEEFRNLMFTRGSKKFKDIKILFNEKIDNLKKQLMESTKRKQEINAAISKWDELDAKDKKYFSLLAKNAQQINALINTSCKKIDETGQLGFTISNQSNFDIYLGQIYADYISGGAAKPRGLLVENELAYKTIKSKSDTTLPIKDLRDKSICQYTLKERIITEIADSGEHKSFLGNKQTVWIPRKHSKNVKALKLELEALNNAISAQNKTLQESNEVITKSADAIRMISFMEYTLSTKTTS